jgi:hypothetical protein
MPDKAADRGELIRIDSIEDLISPEEFTRVWTGATGYASIFNLPPANRHAGIVDARTATSSAAETLFRTNPFGAFRRFGRNTSSIQ